MDLFTSGYISGLFSDPERQNWNANGARPISWSMWYPADPEAVVTEQFVGEPGRPLFSNGSVAASAPLSASKKTYPLVLLSHGTGGSALGVGWFGRRLAEAGFIVIGANHHGNTAEEPYRAEGFWCWWERSQDLTKLADFIFEHPDFGGKINSDQVFAAGHSLGGHTVLASAGAVFSIDRFLNWLEGQPGYRGPREFPDLADRLPELEKTSAPLQASLERHGASYRDPRLKAVFAMAPAPTVRSFTPESLSAIDIPVLIQTGEADMECPVETCTSWLGDQNSGFAVEILPGEVGHYVYLSEATAQGMKDLPDVCVDPASVSRATIHGHAAKCAIRHFQATM